MKCTNCQGEWTPPANKSLSTCPFCQADILQMLNEQAEVLSTEVILANMLQAYGTELLQNQQRLTAMISDLFAHDHKTKRLLLLSVREGVPAKLILLADDNNRNTHIVAIQQHLAEDAFLKNEIAEEIVNLWTKALGYSFEEPDDSFQIVWQNGFCGFRNAKGEMITPYKYDNAFAFSEGLARVKLNGKWGSIDKTGNEIIPFIYDNLFPFRDGKARVILNEKCGYINSSGEVIIPLIYNFIFPFSKSESLTAVKVNDKYGYIDKLGKVIIPLMYDMVHLFSDGLAPINLNGKWGFIDNSGKEIRQLKYDDVWSIRDGLARVKLNNKCGFIDKSGKEIIPLKYDDAGAFCDGLARVNLNGKRGYIDKFDKWVKDE